MIFGKRMPFLTVIGIHMVRHDQKYPDGLRISPSVRQDLINAYRMSEQSVSAS